MKIEITQTVEINTFGDFIQYKRKKQNISCKQLAEVADTDKVYVSKILHNAVNPPSEKILLKWCELLNVDKKEMFLWANRKDCKTYVEIIEKENEQMQEEIKRLNEQIKLLNASIVYNKDNEASNVAWLKKQNELLKENVKDLAVAVTCWETSDHYKLDYEKLRKAVKQAFIKVNKNEES